MKIAAFSYAHNFLWLMRIGFKFCVLTFRMCKIRALKFFLILFVIQIVFTIFVVVITFLHYGRF